jgi:hypothetical protein
MTDQQLRDLLEERVADLTMPDLSAVAWRAGRRAERRRRLAVVGCVAIVGSVMSVGVTALGDQGRSTAPAPAPGVPTSPQSAAPTRTPDADPGAETPDSRYRGAAVWSAPLLAEEAELARLEDTVLPAEIDLSPGRPPVAGLGRAVAVLGVWPDGDLSRVVAVGADGGSYALDVDGVVGRVADEEGNVLASLTADGLSPDGRYVFFFQERSLEVYDFGTDAWTHIDTPAWLAEGARWVAADRIHVPEQLGSTAGGTTYDPDGREVDGSDADGPVLAWPSEDEVFGPLKAGWGELAQGLFLADGVALDGATFGGLDAVVATDRRETHLLVFAALDDRWKGCCPVVGWSAPGTVLFEARHSDARVLAWSVGTHDVRQVSDITGWEAGQESYVASWAVNPDGA